MSAWSWVARIGGYAAAPFTGGASIPIGEGIAQGISANEATNKQNEQLQAGNQAAMDVYSKTLQPAVDRGNAAGSTLAMMMGLPQTPQAQAPTANVEAPPLPITQEPKEPSGMVRPDMRAIPGLPPTELAAMRGRLASLNQPSASSYKMVRMQSPDGTEEQDVPEQFASQLEQAGARRVG
jgi:hypothetical protein